MEVLGEAGGLGWTLEVVQYAKLGSRQVPALKLFVVELRTIRLISDRARV